MRCPSKSAGTVIRERPFPQPHFGSVGAGGGAFRAAAFCHHVQPASLFRTPANRATYHPTSRLSVPYPRQRPSQASGWPNARARGVRGHASMTLANSGSAGVFSPSTVPDSVRSPSEIGVLGGVGWVCSTPLGVLFGLWRRVGSGPSPSLFDGVRPLALDARVAFPDAPDLVLVGRLGVVG